MLVPTSYRSAAAVRAFHLSARYAYTMLKSNKKQQKMCDSVTFTTSIALICLTDLCIRLGRCILIAALSDLSILFNLWRNALLTTYIQPHAG
jgi:hypothetical protein